MSYRTVLLGVALLLLGGLLLAQVPPEERIPITNPDRLESLGQSRNAKNVYVWSKADLKGGTALVGEAVASPETWGPATGYSSVLGIELQPVITDLAEFTRDPDYGTFCHSSVTGSAAAVVQIEVPDGAKLGPFRFWAYDAADPGDLRFSVYETCQLGTGPPTTTLIGETQTFLAVGDYAGFTPLNDLAVNNRDCAYAVRVQFATGGEGCAGGDLAVRKLQLTWNRQVSPAPAVATFDDVPTNHPFFQFIEALSKSGTTAGCQASPPLYCPDRPITRGEMAVYLAKALGLQWP